MRISTIFLSVFGIALPFIALLVESSTGMCASVLLDPIPTILHSFLVAFVPSGITYLVLKTKSNDFNPAFIDFLIVGIVLAISGIYTVLFAPALIPGVMSILIYGIGFLPLAPLASFISALILFRRLFRKRRDSEQLQNIWSVGSFGAIFCCIAGVVWGSSGGENFVLSMYNHQLF